jgi:hypothetical protein
MQLSFEPYGIVSVAKYEARVICIKLLHISLNR